MIHLSLILGHSNVFAMSFYSVLNSKEKVLLAS